MDNRIKLNKLTMCQIICIIVSVPIFIYGKINIQFNTQLVAIMLVWLSNLLFSINKFRERTVFFFFNITIFVFLLSNPFITMFRTWGWWVWGNESAEFTMNVMYMTLISLVIGANIANYLINKFYVSKLVIPKNLRYRKVLVYVSGLAYLLSFSMNILTELEKLKFVKGTNYESFYSSFNSELPFFVRLISSMNPYLLCIFLACMPKKIYGYIALSLSIIGSIPLLLMGQRGPFMLKVLFALIYFIIRDYLEDEKKWIGRIEKVLIIVSAPSVIILMGAYNYIRAQTNLETKGFVSLIVDFFYKQGTTFDTLGFGYNMLPKLPFVEIKNYTFGGFIDFFKYSIIGKIFFNGTTIPTNNSPEQGMMTNSMAHNLAYVYRKNEYLNGNGNGSSYLLELFADYNYLGVIIGSILLGIILVYLVFLMKRNNAFLSSLILISISNIFFVPRSEATGWIQFIIKPRFILSMGICFIGAYLISKILRKCYSGGKL
ncbi:hypothetical protein P782_1761 [Enterococcus faecalis FL2]|uniref:O-antigen polysaccharide polymerase Wzy family protein n=1 Tax=Enterococcus TaxID=1350 RepID=UPI00045A411B|nr:O-antigen polysaccharide polymerase Wzy family protein [Enterococcus faecalis]KAJ60707.1 hypothetical protein P782_1761 [Enterococcus faecalis FL2]